MSGSELEDGELPSDEDEVVTTGQAANGAQSTVISPSSLPPQPIQFTTTRQASSDRVAPPRVDVYRSTEQYSESESEESDSDDEAGLWERKRTKFQQRMMTSGATNFSNPLLTQSNSGSLPPRNSISGSSDGKRRVNNIWGSVLNEQSIVGALGTTLTDTSYKGSQDFIDDRDVENYDFTKKYEDDRESLPSTESEKEGELFTEVVDLPEGGEEVRSNRKRKHREKSRRHERSQKRKENRQFSSSGDRQKGQVTEKDSVSKVANYIRKELDEPKYYLIERVVHVVGKAEALKLLSMTQNVEEAGGMMIKSGKRRRSPGGCFLQLLRDSKDFSKQQMDQIFIEEDDKFQRKIALKARRKLKKSSGKTSADMETDAVRENGGSTGNHADGSRHDARQESDKSESDDDLSLDETEIVDVPLS